MGNTLQQILRTRDEKKRDGLMKAILCAIAFLLATNVAWADITWKGLYRVEGNYFKNLGFTKGTGKEYGLHHFVLSPKIVLLDGFELFGTIDILNQGDFSAAGSQAGQSFGAGFTPPTGSFYGVDGAPALTDHQLNKVRDLNIRELYLKYSHTGGELTVGRRPLHFGLGINLNSGDGDFDHWFDNRDMVAYKLYMGSLTFEPFLARVTDGFNTSGESSSEFGIFLGFSKPENGLEMGAMYMARHTPGAINYGHVATSGAAATQRYGAFIERQNPGSSFRYAIELGLNGGHLGYNASGDEISNDGFGFLAEMDYETPLRGLSVGIQTGFAGGQDGSKDNGLSSFAFDRNFDLGLLMFNHPVGHPDLDLFGTTPYGKQGSYQGSGNYAVQNSIDTESLSNAMFAAPYIAYQGGKSWGLKSKWIWAQLDKDIVNSVLYSTVNPGLKVDKDLGLEWDISFTYRPFEKIVWETTLGILFPGDAFKGGTNDYKTKTIYGGVSRVSIRLD